MATLVLHHEKCTLCGLCIEACDADRTGCLRLEDSGEKVIGACDFCGGNPSCVLNCPENCLRYMPERGVDGSYWACKSDEIAPLAYTNVFGDAYEDWQKLQQTLNGGN